ncbi:CPBP family intramembrane glutamic endopeptidase [Staphylococcus ratti]|uniref:CPBP family intramembrane metalloprotease n=1 Tax=Staphylococcus ratti TaxID=2892440 RepID=A0ABY3PDY2_9STAP|nr:type II CAAX endopeptidase family protein [Staphylococcus ratti]UEX90525.1 CPBP family intramembrane metalloprotease [Staphylococcus ratti]
MKKYQWKDIRWRNFLLIPILIVAFMIIAVIAGIFAIIFTEYFGTTVNHQKWEALSVLMQLTAYIVVVFAFFLINIDLFKRWMKEWWFGIKKGWLWIGGLYLVSLGVMYAFGEIKKFFPQIFTNETTQNEQLIEQLFSIPQMLPFNFLLIVLLGPIVEEIFFRHILIGELGKKFNFIVMSLISVILFSAIHLVSFSNWVDIFDYLIIAIPLVFLYMKYSRNLGVAIAYHMLNNLVSFLISVLW